MNEKTGIQTSSNDLAAKLQVVTFSVNDASNQLQYQELHVTIQCNFHGSAFVYFISKVQLEV